MNGALNFLYMIEYQSLLYNLFYRNNGRPQNHYQQHEHWSANPPPKLQHAKIQGQKPIEIDILSWNMPHGVSKILTFQNW